MEAPADSVSDQGLISGLEMDLLSVTSRGRRCQGVLWGLFCNGTNLIHEGSTLMTYHLLKAPPLNGITLQVGF